MAKRRTRAITRYIRRRGRRHNTGFKLSVAVVAGFVPGVINTFNGFQAGGVLGGTRVMGNIYLGYDWQTGQWQPRSLMYGLFPIVIGVIIHRAASMLGINRAIAAAGIPFIRI